MTTWFVSRHKGAIAWAKEQKLHIDRWVTHLDINQIKTNDTVIGTLPIHMVANICSRGARFFLLELNLKKNQRGIELSKQDMLSMRCLIKEYFVQPICKNKSLPSFGKIVNVHSFI